MITENIIKKKLYDVITEELGIADLVSKISIDILYKAIEGLNNDKNPIKILDVLSKKTISFKYDINGTNVLVTVYNYNFKDKEAFEEHCKDYDCYTGMSMKNGSLCFMDIHCYSINGALDKPSAMDAIQHEVEHFFQDSEGDESVFRFYPNYTNASQYIYSINSEDRNLAQCIYMTYRFEQDAFVNGLYGYLKQKEKRIPEWNDIFDSDAYANIVKFENAIEYLENNKDDGQLINTCREKYNMTVQHLINISRKALKRIYNSIGKVLVKIRNENIKEGYSRLYITSAKHGKPIYWL